MMRTKEGGRQHEHSLDHALEFFSKAGSLFEKADSFYDGQESALSLFQKTWIVDKETSFKLLLWLRDCRGGAGNRSGFRSCLRWLANHEMHPSWVEANIHWIPEVGRWDDLRALFGTDCERKAIDLWTEDLLKKDVRAAKWADRKDFGLKHALGFRKEGDFRKYLAKLRKNHIVEHKMSTRRWTETDYHTVPSLAKARYTNAFGKHDENRFTNYKESLKKGETTVHAGVLFPHDCVRTARHGDEEIADAQFEALPNYMEGVDERIIVISDTSGSMEQSISGSIKAVDVSQAMALYCSAKIPHGSPFYKKFIGFCSESRFKDWSGMSFSEAVSNRAIFDGAVGSTRIDKALDLILKTAKFFSLPQTLMPTALLIVSDMQFHEGASDDINWSSPVSKRTKGTLSEIRKALDRWVRAGYEVPKIIYWNTSAYAGSPDTAQGTNVALVSGFSPAVLKAIFSGADLSPVGVMKRALEKYKINIPK
jgi:hypothetical protein